MLAAREISLALRTLAVALAFLHGVQGHGHLVSPRSRNYVANQDGREGTPTRGSPPPEYCPHCLNGNRGVCGLSPSYDYDLWLDSTGAAMPWVSQASYTSGSVIRVRSHLSAHHGGHMELKACPNGRQATQACLDQNVLTFVRDVLHGMPADPAHPERGYYSGGAYSGVSSFEMEFKLPANLVGSNVLLQWKYITANSCSPPGYREYFGGQNSQSTALPDSYWGPSLSVCQVPYPQDGSRTGGIYPEQFFNCGEITIIGSGSSGNSSTTAAPTNLRRPTKAPSKTPTKRPTTKPTKSPTKSPLKAASTKAPTKKPTAMAPTKKPTTTPKLPTKTPTRAPVAPSGSSGCCSHDFKTCIAWCGSTQNTCGSCNAWERFRWLPTGAVASCRARWEECTNNATACCPGLVCQAQDPWYSQCLPAP